MGFGQENVILVITRFFKFQDRNLPISGQHMVSGVPLQGLQGNNFPNEGTRNQNIQRQSQSSKAVSEDTINQRLCNNPSHRCVSCPLVLVCFLVHFHFNLVSSVLAPFQIGQLRWCEMMIELEPSFQNRTGRRNHKSARGHETALSLFQLLPVIISFRIKFIGFETFNG